MVFEGLRGNGFTGDIAIDDVSYTVGSCVIKPTTAVPRPPTTSRPATTRQPTPRPTGYNCDFQTNFCTWTKDASAPFNWTRHRSSTASLDTGPAYDHTLKNGRKFLAKLCTNMLNIARTFRVFNVVVALIRLKELGVAILGSPHFRVSHALLMVYW